MLIIKVLCRLPRVCKYLVTPLIMWVAFVISRFEARQVVISTERGHNAPASIGPRVVVFSHFDRHGQVRDHTRAYIDALRAEGLDVVFVSNARRLAPSDLAWVRERAAHIVMRRNLGYDFAAWRDAMTACGLPAANTSLLLLTNDSVYGPFCRLGPVLGRMDFNEADVWGATDSWQHCFHLQSFFLAFGPKAFNHEAFELFWRSVRNVRSKAWVVRRYEIGLSRSLIDAGLRCRALWPYVEMIGTLRKSVAEQDDLDSQSQDGSTLQIKPEQRNSRPSIENPFVLGSQRNAERVLRIAYRRRPLNPTADLWRVLLEQGFPFLKRELLRVNPSQVPDVAAWSFVVNKVHGFDVDVVLRDLERSLKNRTP
jgi:Rhamnan synthesis protein F